MMEPGEAIQDRFRLKPLAIAFAAVLAVGCGGGGGGGGGGGDDSADGGGDDSGDGDGGDSALTSAQKESVATTSATQVTGFATGTRTLAQQGSTINSGDDVDGLFNSVPGTSALSNSMDAITHSSHNPCTSGSFSTAESDDGVTVTADDCKISEDGDIDLDVTADGELTNSVVDPNTDGDTEVSLDSKAFSITLDRFFVAEQTAEDGTVVLPEIGPIEGRFTTQGGYKATIGTDDSLNWRADSWEVGFGLSCDGQGFEFDFGAENLEISSNVASGGGLESEINGTVGWGIDADVWDTLVDQELSYETTESIFIPVGATEPSEGTLVVTFADGEEVTLEYESGGISVNGTSYTYDELSDKHDEELGGDLEESALGSCGGF